MHKTYFLCFPSLSSPCNKCTISLCFLFSSSQYMSRIFLVASAPNFFLERLRLLFFQAVPVQAIRGKKHGAPSGSGPSALELSFIKSCLLPSPNVQHIFTKCSQNVHDMVSTCSPRVHQIVLDMITKYS